MEGNTNMKLNFGRLLNKAQVFTADNSPTILTAVGVTGALTGAYLASKASIRAVDILEIDDAERLAEGRPQATRADQIKLLWKLYIPAAGVLTLTCASIICANRIGMRRTATAAAAAALAERGWDEYKEQVRAQIGKQKSKQVDEAVAQKKVDKYVADNGPVIIPTEGKVWCMDGYTGRPIETTINAVEKAVNQINRQIQSKFEGHATVADFYDLIGLRDASSLADEMGWHQGQVVELTWTTCANPDKIGPAFHVFDFKDETGSRPVMRPWARDSFR